MPYAEAVKKMEAAQTLNDTVMQVMQDAQEQVFYKSYTSISIFAAYFIVSSTMLLFNKACMIVLPAPCTVTLLQVSVTALLLAAAWCCSLVDIQAVSRVTLSHYVLYSLVFVLGINFTMRALASTNVETVLLFRSCSPVLVSAIDTICLGREIPSRRSCLAMLCIVLGGTWFAWSELRTHTSSMMRDGLFVNTVNLVLTAVLMTWGKHVTDTNDVNLTTSVFICNVTSIAPILALAILEKEHLIIREHRWLSVYAVSVLATSCVMGTALSYLGWKMRVMMSAASFTVVGVLNKIFTVLVNVVVWQDHAMWSSTIGLLVSLIAGCFYQQSRLR
jgi:drug/metabolite transporter (DMT)-like permease